MKKIFTLALSLLFIIAPQILLSQNELTVHNGTNTNGYVPIYGYYSDAYLKAEMVYPAAELTQMAGGNITGMTFYASQANVDWGTTFQVFMAEVVDATISSFYGPGTVVYEGTLVIQNNELVVEFTTPFQYGGGNLLVGVYQTDKGDYIVSNWYGENVAGASVQGYHYSSLSDIDATQRNFLPKTTFSYTPAGSVACPKPIQFAVSDVTDHTAVLSWESNASSWQICLNGDESNLISVNTNHYTLTGLTAETYNNVKVRSVCANEVSAWSTIIAFWATDNKVIGSGTASHNELPSHSYYRYALSQQIYTAQEIGTPCTIHSIAFYNADTNKTRNYDMYLVLTDKTSFANSTDWIPVTSSDLVFSGEVTMAAHQWTVFDINDFLYDGTSNLALVVDDNTGSYTSSPHMACLVFAASGMALQKYSDGTNYDPVHPDSYSGNVMNVKNQIMMDITPIDGNVCFSPATLSVNNVTAHAATVSWSGGSGVYNVEYKKASDEDWTVYAHGTTNLSFTMTNLSQATEYQVQVQSVCADGVSSWKSIIFTSGVVSTDHLYVTENGQGEGESWSTATNDLQSAVNTALAIRNVSGITPDIWVAAGTYYGDITADNAFTMVNGVNVYGGFAGNEPANYDLSLRNLGTNTTILDGQNARRVLYQLSDFSTETTWDGFTIQNGQISGYGGGAYLKRNGRLSHCRIEGNTATYDGGGVYCSSNSIVENCDIIGNTSGDDGGGMYAYNSTILNCQITKNTSNYYGGGLYVSYGVVRNCLVSNNTSRYSGGGIYSYNNSQINNTIVRNSSGSEGAGVYANYNASLTNCILWGNEKNGVPNNIGGTSTVENSAVEGGCEGDSIIVLNENNLPLFVNPSSTAGASVSTSNADWHLQNGSVCVNRGSNAAVNDSLDLDGTARIKRDTVDLGCYESNYYSVPVQYCSTVHSEFSDTACNSYTWNDQIYTYSGNFSQSFELPNGCDSVVTLHLIVKHAVTIHEYLTICENELPYTYRDTTFGVGTSGTSVIQFSLSTADICDSIVALHLTVQSSTLGDFGAMTPTNNYPVSDFPIQFTWDAVENASGYDLYVWPVGASQPQQPTRSHLFRPQCSIAGLPNHQNYQWLVMAYNSCDTAISPIRQFSLNVAPLLIVNASNPIDFGEVQLNSARSLYFQVDGIALDEAITYQLTGTDASAFSLAPTNTWDSMSGGRMQLTFHPQTVQNEYTALLTIQSHDAVRTFTVKGCLDGFLTFTTYVDANVYAMNSNIPIHGQVINALNEPVAGLDVDVYVSVMDYVRTYPATTDASGQFTVTFSPQPSEAGYYTVGSCRAGRNSTDVHDDFNIPGMMLASSDWILWEPTVGQSDTGVIVVRNRSQIPLTNIQVTPVSLPNGCTVEFAPLNLAGLAYGELQYTVSGSQFSTGVNYEEARLNAVSAEGAVMSFSAWYYCAPKRADLDVMPTSLTATMSRGNSKVVDLKIYNNGTGPTGTIQVSLPSLPWMSVVGGDTLPSLAVHDSSYVSIRLSADSTTDLIRYTGNIAVNCERGEGVSIPFDITAISDSTGTLVVDVTDEYTWNTNNGHGPHLAGANVLVKGYYSLETVAVGVTDSNGLFVVNDLPEGWYKLIIRAESHEEYQNNIYVTAGETNQQDIFIQFQAITYSWDVVSTDIEDVYTYELTSEFETHVPKPVVVLSMPENIPELEEGESYTFDFILTNYGLLAAFDVQLYTPISSLYSFSPLFDRVDSLPAQTTMIIPCVMNRLAQTRAAGGSHSSFRDGESSDQGSCPNTIMFRTVSYYFCAGSRQSMWSYVSRNVGSVPCTHYPNVSVPTYNYGPSTVSASGYIAPPPISTPLVKCECEDEITRDTTYYNEFDTNQVIICYTVKDCVTEEIGYYCDTVVREYDETHCEVTVAIPPVKMKIWQTPSDYKIAKVDNPKGVAADGVSELKIYVSSTCELTPDQLHIIFSCQGTQEQSDDVRGKVLEIVNKDKTGKTNNKSLEITYQAPPKFPLDVTKEYKVNLTLMVEMEDTIVVKTVPISVVRTPVLLVHGLASDMNCFTILRKQMMQYYQIWQLKTVDYSETNTSAFRENKFVVRDNITRKFMTYAANGYVVAKADLVGHSMGGILSRMHVQEVNNNNVHKVITVNTPHSGTQFADFGVELAMGNYVDITSLVKMKATDDLRTQSFDIFMLNHVNLERMEGIPVHAIGTSATIDQVDVSSQDEAWALYSLVGTFDPLNDGIKDTIKSILSNSDYTDYLWCKLTPKCNYANHLMAERPDIAACLLNTFLNHLYKDESDVIVPLRSQKGGLTGNHVTVVNGNFAQAFHSGAQDNPQVMNTVIDLLKAPTNDPRFCMDGYQPESLPYPSQGPTWSYGACNSSTPNGQPLQTTNSRGASRSSSDSAAVQSSLQLTAEYDPATRVMTTICDISEDVEELVVVSRLSDGKIFYEFQDTAYVVIPASYKGNVNVFAYGVTDSGNVVIDSSVVLVNQYGTVPQSIYLTEDTLYVLEQDTVSFMMECAWTNGDTTFITPVLYATDTLLTVTSDGVIGLHAGASALTAQFEGLTATIPVMVCGWYMEVDTTGTNEDGNDSLKHTGVCASVTVQFSQKMTMTREAFQGTLTINNGHENQPMQNIDVEFVIKDEDGVDCTNLFQINFLSYNNIIGTNGNASLDAQESGSLVVQFIPTKYAAPTIAKRYAFGGSFSFLDPFSGESMTYNLYPVDIMVHPSPDLYVNYFMQRDILGDDPLTEDRVEPIVPAELGVIIHNRGAGTAQNVQLETAEPRIVDNDKGLAVNFAMYGAAFNGSERQLGLMEIPFGNIEPNHTGVGEWWFTSTLLGHFISYEAHVIHNNSFGNPDLSLVSSLQIHPLIHTVYAYGNLDDGINDFLVDDVEDNQNYPDSLYFSNGSRTGVATADSISFDHYVTPTDTIVILTLDPSRIGWNYEQTSDPGLGQYKLISCTRNSDQQTIPLSNVWQTFVTLPVGADPVYENKLHIVDTLSNDLPTTYTLVFGLKSQVLEVDTILNVPDNIVTTPLSEVTVKFNKPIVDSTFDYQDMSMKCNNGPNLFDENLIVERIDSMTYKLHLGPYTQQSGYYVLNIQTLNITDMDGFNGFYGKQATWIQNISCDADSTFFSATACDSYEWNGLVYVQSGEYVQHFTNVDDCDSLVTLNLTILHGDYSETVVSSCNAGYYWALADTTLTLPGTYYHYSTNANGCTDTTALVLSLYSPVTTEIMVQICEGEVYNQNGFNVSTAGDHQLNLQTVHGCDSTVILHLTIGNEFITYFTASICEGESYNGYGFDITSPAAGVHQYSDTVVRPGTCDSVAILTLTVNSTTYGDTTAVVNGSFNWYEHTNITQSGDYTHVFTNAMGCDSVVTLHLTVNVTVFTEFTDAACDSYVWNNMTYTASGDYTQSFTATTGCDSIVTLHLTIYESPVVQAITGETELCLNQYATYYYDVSDPNYQYKWFKNNTLWMENVPQVTLHEMNVGSVLLTMQMTDVQSGCMADTSLLVQVVNRVAPDTTEIRRKVNSNMLFCQPVSSSYGTVHYRWGYTELGTNSEVVIPGDRNYCMYDFGIDTFLYRYWVETYLTNSIGEGCDNRSYYGHSILTSTSDYDANVVEAYMLDGNIVLHVGILSPDVVSAALYDVNGKQLLTRRYGETDIVSDMIPLSYAPGIYILRVSVGNQLYPFKLLKL